MIVVKMLRKRKGSVAYVMGCLLESIEKSKND